MGGNEASKCVGGGTTYTKIWGDGWTATIMGQMGYPYRVLVINVLEETSGIISNLVLKKQNVERSHVSHDILQWLAAANVIFSFPER